MLSITDALISGMNRPGRSLVDLRGIAIHYTGNSDPSANAMNNRHYFNNNQGTYASAHYVVDENSIVRCIPDNEVAYHVGANEYTPAANQMTGGHNPNNYLIGIEICNNGNWSVAVENAAELTAYLIKIHGLPANCLWRHYDVTWKDCPSPMVQDPSQWEAFKSRVSQLLNGGGGVTPSNNQTSTQIGIVEASGGLNLRTGAGTNYSIITTIPNGAQVGVIYNPNNGWFYVSYNGTQGYVYGQYLKTSGNSIYAGPSTPTPTPVTPSPIGHGVVNANGGLNVRSGPGSNYGIIGSLPYGTAIDIYQSSNGWYQIHYNDQTGWVSGSYVK